MQVKDFITIEKKDGIATLWLDHQFEKMNVASPAVIEIMAKVSPMIEEDASIKAAIIISRKPDFMAGADIKAFAIEKKGDFRPFQEGGHQSLLRLENSQKPIVAAINGACLGLGLELALACHARIATSASRTVFGLPEVKLGILPGGGGTQRLPRLVGIQKALDMMLTGKNIYASRAKKMGLVDELTHENKLHYAATILAKKLIKKPLERKSKLTLVEKLLESNPVGRSIVFSQARKIAMKQSQGNYPAIPAILDCVETGYKEGIGAGYEKELEHFEDLILTPESAALRSVFFAITENKKNPYPSSDFKIETLGMIGAGFMGAGIAEVTVTKGIEVLLKDIKEPVLASAYRQIWKSLEKKVKRKSITKTQAEEQIGNLTGQLTYDNFEHADIVIEAVLEVMKLKKIIIGDIEKHGKEDVIIATNTSSLSVTEMTKHAKRPEMVIGMHYFSPVPKMPLLEIVKTDLTSEAVISACYDLGLKQGKTVVVVKDGPGFYVNRILAPYLNECLLMIEEDLAIDAIDKALLKKGFPVGPITLLDQVGLDIAAHVTESTRVISEGREGMIISEGVTEMAAAGYYGKKNKLGFYHYDEKTGKRKGVNSDAYPFFKGDGTKTLPVEDIQNRALMLMLNEAVLCLEEGIIAQPADGDLGAVFGIGFLPFTGGPFRYMDTLGIKKVLAIMDYLKGKYGVKFTPAETLVRMGKSESRFYE